MGETLRKELSQILNNFLPADIKVRSDNKKEKPESGVFTWMSTMDEDKLTGAIAADWYAANYLGAVLTRMPAGPAESAAGNGDISDMGLDNCGEVFNVLNRLFDKRFRDPYSIEDVVAIAGNERLPKEINMLYGNVSTHQTFDVDVQGYGNGELTLLIK